MPSLIRSVLAFEKFRRKVLRPDQSAKKASLGRRLRSRRWPPAGFPRRPGAPAGSPTETGPLRCRPVDGTRNIPLQRSQHGIAALTVNGPDEPHVAVEKSFTGDLEGDHLRE